MSAPAWRARAVARWREWRLAWEKLSPAARNLRTAAAAAGLAGLYGLTLWPLAEERIAKARYELEKQAVREKKTAKAAAAPAPALPPGLAGKSAAAAKDELAALKARLDELQGELRALRGRFAPIEDSLAMNALKSGLTTLAEAGDMEVVAIRHVHLRPEDEDRPPTPQMLQAMAEANPLKRPLLVLRARASFRGLMQFLDGLARLPYVAAPVGCDIAVQVERHSQTKAPVRQWLDVHIKFAV